MKKLLITNIILLIILIAIGVYLIFKRNDLQEQINYIEINLKSYFQTLKFYKNVQTSNDANIRIS